MKQKLPKLSFFILLILGLIFSQNLDAQSEYGIKSGILFSNIKGSGLSSNLDFDSKNGFTAGAFFKKKKLLGQVGFQGEILYQNKGADIFIKPVNANSPYLISENNVINTTDSYYLSKENLHYLSLPLLVTIPATRFFEFYTGPEFNYLLSMNSSRIETTNLNRLTMGIASGIALKLGENTNVDFRYTFDITSFDNIGSEQQPAKLRNDNFAITIQQTIFRKK